MKYLISTILLLLFSSTSYAQIRPDFNDTIHIGNTQAFFKVFNTDSCYYTVGHDSTLFLAKFDFTGNLINVFHSNLKNTMTFYARYSSIEQRGSKFILFSYTNDSNNIRSGLLAVLNYQFDTLWTKAYSYNDLGQQSYINNIFTDIQFTPDGGYLISGNNFDSYISGNGSHGFILKTDSLGNKQWYREFQGAVNINNIRLTPDLGILIYVSEYNEQSIIKTSALGNVIWKKRIKHRLIWGDKSDLEYAGGDDFVVLRSNFYGDINNSSTWSGGVNIIKINYHTGNFVFDTIYRPFVDFPSSAIHTNILSNGKILVYGTAYTYENANSYYGTYCEKGAMIVYSSNGDSLTTHLFDIGYKHAREDWLADIKITADGGFLGCGEHTTLTFGKNSCFSSPWIFKYTPSWATYINKSDSRTRNLCFPNPSNDIFNIQFIETTKEDHLIIVYDILGSEIKRITLKRGVNICKINLNDFDSGIYIYKILNDSKVISSGKLIKN